MARPAALSRIDIERLNAIEPWIFYGVLAPRLAATLLRGGQGLTSERDFSSVYDALGAALLRGEATLPLGIIGGEGFIMPWGRVTYFGVLPALPRAFLDALWPAMFGRWTGLSCLAAALLCVWASRRALAHSLAQRDDLDLRTRLALRSGIGALMGLGSPVLLLVCDASIFTEAIVWSLAFSLLALAPLRALASRVDAAVGAHLALGLCAAAALNTRATFATPLLLMVGVVGARVLTDRTALSRRARVARMVALSAPVALGLAVLLAYNRLRWGSALTFIVPDAYALRAKFSVHFDRGIFHPWRVPWGAINWSLPRPSFFTSSFPFVSPGHAMSLPAPAWGGYSEPFLPLPIVAPALLTAAAAGIRALRSASVTLRILVAAFALQLVSLFAYFNIAPRYAAEFLPALLLLAGLGVEGLPRDARSRARSLGVWFAMAALSVTVHLAVWG